MNAILKAQNAYGNDAQLIRTDRDTEYNAFAKVTHRLKAALPKTTPFSEVVSGLHDNKRLWTLLAMDVADPANPLPKELRARIVYLAEFTIHHSSLVLAKKATMEPLIEINTAVMRGLRNERVR